MPGHPPSQISGRGSLGLYWHKVAATKHASTNKTRRYPPRSASWIEEMEKRSRRRTRDLVTQAASQGLSDNEIGYARISMMARSTNAPCKGRIQMRKTNHLHLFTFGLQRTAGPYSWVKRRNTRSE